MNFFITILIPSYNEEKYIDKCLFSVVNSDYPNDLMEVFIIDGMSTDSTRSKILYWENNYSNIKLIDNPSTTVPVGLNIGIGLAKGEYIIRLDSHSKYPKDYFSKLIKSSLKYNADNIGGICLVETLNSTSVSKSIKNALMDKYGVGNSSFRIGTAKIKEVDTVPFGCFKKDVFSKYGYFNEKLRRNQDIEFNHRIVSQGGKIILDPNITCTYYSRDNYQDFIINNFNNGKWNIYTLLISRSLSSLSIRHFVPLVFVLSLIIPTIIYFFNYTSKYMLLPSIVLLVYLVVFSYRSILLTNKYMMLIQLLTYFVLHISYGVGSLAALCLTPLLTLKIIFERFEVYILNKDKYI